MNVMRNEAVDVPAPLKPHFFYKMRNKSFGAVHSLSDIATWMISVLYRIKKLFWFSIPFVVRYIRASPRQKSTVIITFEKESVWFHRSVQLIVACFLRAIKIQRSLIIHYYYIDIECMQTKYQFVRAYFWVTAIKRTHTHRAPGTSA